MCGIAGIVSTEARPLGPAVDALAHRGPDGRGTWTGPAGGWTVGLAHTRLAVIDLSPAGAQPMWDDASGVGIVFNGEVYNFRALRRTLERRGHTFRSGSDTEVVLRGYLELGDHVVDSLRGMYAFAIWDGRERRLLLARDRLGIKPLYWADVPGGIAFASELKGLFALGVQAKIAPGAIDRFLTYLYVPGPETAFSGVRELPPAHLLSWSAGRIRLERTWDVPAPRTQDDVSDDELATELRRLLEEVIDLHMVADVPVGAFLSGGLDSSTIVALMAQRSSRPVKTFTMVFGPGEELYDERAYAREVATRFGTEHREIRVNPDLVELLPRLLHHFDQPFGNPTALLSYELSRLTREHVTVALAGDGGDESFVGYPRYAGAWLSGWYRHAPVRLRELARDTVLRRIPESTRGRHALRRMREFAGTGTLPAEEMYARWVGYFTREERRRVLTPENLAREPPELFLEELFAGRDGAFVDRATSVDLRSFLPNNLLAYGDRMSMAHGLELRVPFCDHVLVEFMAGIPAARKARRLSLKRLFRRAVRDLLPPRILRRPKLGFNPPMGIWLSRDLGPLVGEALSPAALRRTGLFQPKVVHALVAAHDRGERDLSLHIWAILVAQLWYERQLAGRAADPGVVSSPPRLAQA